MGALVVVGEVLKFAWDNRDDLSDMGGLVLKAIGLSSKENPTEADVVDVRNELVAARARRAANNTKIDDPKNDA